jgi:hypothetical protein
MIAEATLLREVAIQVTSPSPRSHSPRPRRFTSLPRATHHTIATLERDVT